jgi:REP element-mobilizing transposase RayT
LPATEIKVFIENVGAALVAAHGKCRFIYFDLQSFNQLKMDNFDPYIHHRRSIRLGEYDYALEGLYFITLCIHNYQCLLGEIPEDSIILNDAGKMIETEFQLLSNRFPTIQLHEYIVMPNHFHAIIQISNPQDINLKNGNFENGIVENVGAALVAAHDNENKITTKNKPLGDIIGAFKSITTVKYIQGVKSSGWTHFENHLWQVNYWEHIIRKQESYQKIADYIMTNPAKWKEDKFHL